jgi:hypothetical protein
MDAATAWTASSGETMADRPPRNPDDLSLGGIVDEVVSQVRVALDEADVTGRHGRELLLDGLRDVLHAMDPASVVRSTDAKRKPKSTDVPDVTVVDGGRADDAPPTEGQKPDLKVAEPDSPDPVEDTPRVYTRVTVHKAQKTAPPDGLPRVELHPTTDTDTWRSLFRGAVPRPYRLTVEKGRVRVSLDGMPADVIGPGASLDVEAAVIQVSLDGETPAAVRYERLPG